MDAADRYMEELSQIFEDPQYTQVFPNMVRKLILEPLQQKEESHIVSTEEIWVALTETMEALERVELHRFSSNLGLLMLSASLHMSCVKSLLDHTPDQERTLRAISLEELRHIMNQEGNNGNQTPDEPKS